MYTTNLHCWWYRHVYYYLRNSLRFYFTFFVNMLEWVLTFFFVVFTLCWHIFWHVSVCFVYLLHRACRSMLGCVLAVQCSHFWFVFYVLVSLLFPYCCLIYSFVVNCSLWHFVLMGVLLIISVYLSLLFVSLSRLYSFSCIISFFIVSLFCIGCLSTLLVLLFVVWCFCL